jgi:hypothetical protein
VRRAGAGSVPPGAAGILTRMSEPGELPPEEAADDITVGAWADLDQDRSSQDQPDRDDVILEPSAAPPGLWARIVAALRGGS